jgi:hypothetical protein
MSNALAEFGVRRHDEDEGCSKPGRNDVAHVTGASIRAAAVIRTARHKEAMSIPHRRIKPA